MKGKAKTKGSARPTKKDGDITFLQGFGAVAAVLAFAVGLGMTIDWLTSSGKPKNNTLEAGQSAFFTVSTASLPVNSGRQWAEGFVPHRPQFTNYKDDRPPQLVKVGPFFYAVHVMHDDDMPDYFGLTNVISHDIYLSDKLDHSQRRETLLHEIMHTCKLSRWDTPHTDDAFIDSVSPTLSLVMRENEDLVRWLSHPVKGK